MGLHAGEGLLAKVAIDPGDVEVHIGDGVDNEVPFDFLGNMLNDCVLCLCVDFWRYLRR